MKKGCFKHERKQVLCECGCGALIWNYNKNNYGPRRFVQHHQNRGKLSHLWNGGRRITWSGYKQVKAPDHPFAGCDGYIREHRLIWEKHHDAILLPWADIHHIDGNKLNNNIENLHAMMSREHNAMLHTRIRDMCGRFASGM